MTCYCCTGRRVHFIITTQVLMVQARTLRTHRCMYPYLKLFHPISSTHPNLSTMFYASYQHTQYTLFTHHVPSLCLDCIPTVLAPCELICFHPIQFAQITPPNPGAIALRDVFILARHRAICGTKNSKMLAHVADRYRLVSRSVSRSIRLN
jgi:hypothetical protein